MTVVKDSAGIRIVESSQPSWAEGEGWTVDPTPTVDLATSGSGPPHELYRVSDAMRLPSGDVAVSLVDEIRFFSPAGVHLATVGQPGEGPGDFSFIGGIESLPPDSLAVFDLRLARVTVLGPDRAAARSSALGLTLSTARVLGDRLLVMGSVTSQGYEELEPGTRRVPVPVVTATHAGRVLDTIATVAGWESYIMDVEGGFMVTEALFGRNSYVDAHGGEVVTGDAVRLQYRVLDDAGRIIRIVRAEKDLKLTPELLAAERYAHLGDDPTPERAARFDGLPVPVNRPAYRDLRVDATGAVWLQEDRGQGVSYRSTDPAAWEVFGPDGTWLGRVLLPGRFTVREIGVDYVLGVLRDELDVEHVQVLALDRAG